MTAAGIRLIAFQEVNGQLGIWPWSSALHANPP
jgi:hypothetical protein